MLKMNNTGVKKVNVNGNRVHKVTVNGTVVFDDQCYIDWSVTYHSWGNRAGSVWTMFTANVHRSDSYPSVDSKITVVTKDADGTMQTKYYDLPLENEQVSSGGWSAGVYGNWYVWIYIKDKLLTSWDFMSQTELNYDYTYSGREYFYES